DIGAVFKTCIGDALLDQGDQPIAPRSLVSALQTQILGHDCTIRSAAHIGGGGQVNVAENGRRDHAEGTIAISACLKVDDVMVLTRRTETVPDTANRWIRGKPHPTLAWYRRPIARKFDGAQARRAPGRPRIDGEVEQLIVRMAEENRSWGYDRVVGALANLGHEVSDQTVGNVLHR